jgi:DNA-binding Lrp family transcriptional regulator
MPASHPLDAYDTRILAELQADARLSWPNWAAACTSASRR